jgi:AcrR family transcriptional regulator
MAASEIKRRKDDARSIGAVKRDPSLALSKKNGARAAGNAMSEWRARILEVAMRRFAEFGFEATTIRQIADDVDILSGSLYHHFATKDEMLHEIVRDAVKQMRDNTIRIAQSPANAEHKLVALILLDLGELTRNQKVHAILTNDRRFFRQGKEFAYVVQAKKEAYLAWRTVVQDGIDSKLFRPDIDLFLAILTIIRMLNTAADWYKNEEDYVSGRIGTYTLDKVIDFHLEFILSAIRVPARASEPIPRRACEELARFRT